MTHKPEAIASAVDETLEIMRAASAYNAWQYETIAPYVGKRVLEVGAGIGTMSAHILSSRPELLVVTDTDRDFQSDLEKRFAGRRDVVVEGLTLPDWESERRFGSLRLDTIVALNVLEHIDDDVGALASISRALAPGGSVVVLVPAIPILYGVLDRELGHFRRYTPRTLRAVIEKAGLTLERMLWFNRAGVLGWFVNARLLKATRIPIRQLRLFDRCVPILRLEKYFPLPFGQSLIAVARAN